MTDVQTAAPVAMTRIQVRLGDLGLAKENLRFNEPADDGVPQLADTILAAGVVIPPIVRPGKKGERPFMALDGRRRRLGLPGPCRDRGDIGDDYGGLPPGRHGGPASGAIVLPNGRRRRRAARAAARLGRRSSRLRTRGSVWRRPSTRSPCRPKTALTTSKARRTREDEGETDRARPSLRGRYRRCPEGRCRGRRVQPHLP